MTDWSAGSYERTAATLEQVSDVVVDRAGIRPGETVLDIACGTGNAALRAAALGATVTGVDLARRLILVARQRAGAAGADVRFVTGDAQALPVPDASIDVALSVFGVIFAPDAPRAAAEIARVLKPGGRAVVTGWVRRGTLAAVGACMGNALAAAGAPDNTQRRATSSPQDWGDPDSVRALFAAHRVSVGAEAARIAFTAASPEAWEADQVEHHPFWITARRALGDTAFAGVDADVIALLHEANEDPSGFRVTSEYTITTITKD